MYFSKEYIEQLCNLLFICLLGYQRTMHLTSPGFYVLDYHRTIWPCKGSIGLPENNLTLPGFYWTTREQFDLAMVLLGYQRTIWLCHGSMGLPEDHLTLPWFYWATRSTYAFAMVLWGYQKTIWFCHGSIRLPDDHLTLTGFYWAIRGPHLA